MRGIDRDEAVRLERALLAARDRGEALVDDRRAPSFDAFAQVWIDLLPPVVDALKAQKAQQAAERLKAGLGAPEPGRDYVFPGPEGAC